MPKKDPILLLLTHIFPCRKMHQIGISHQLHGGIRPPSIPSRETADSGIILYTILTSSNRRYPRQSIQKPALLERVTGAQFRKQCSATPRKNPLQIDTTCRSLINHLATPQRGRRSVQAGRHTSAPSSTSALTSMPNFRQRTTQEQSTKVAQPLFSPRGPRSQQIKIHKLWSIKDVLIACG